MSVGFTVKDNSGYTSDIDNYLVRREYFSRGSLWAWGRNNYGQLGDYTITDKSSPRVTIDGNIITTWDKISPGLSHTTAIKTDGTLWTWGRNNYGQLGDNTTVHKSSPVQTTAGGNTWINIACGASYTAAIKTDGTLWTWGYNHFGQLGLNNTTSRSSPDQISGGRNTWKYVSCGDYHMASIKTDGTLWTWGYNYVGQLGDNTTVHKSYPVQVVGGGTNWKQVSCGDFHTSAIKTDGTLWTWGWNVYGQLGLNIVSATNKGNSSPVQISGGGTNWKQVSCGVSYTAAIKTDGTLWTWGSNAYGQLGLNDTTSRSSPVQISGGGTNWKQVSCGDFHTSAIKTDGTLWTWGRNNFGQLGTHNISSYSSPIPQIDGYNNWKYISAGSRFSVAIQDNDVVVY